MNSCTCGRGKPADKWHATWCPLKTLVLSLAVASALSGCALEPTSAGLTAEHDSHILQHIGGSRTEHGRDALGVAVTWQRGPVSFELADNYSVHGRDGCLDCTRESFSATVRVEVWHK